MTKTRPGNSTENKTEKKTNCEKYDSITYFFSWWHHLCLMDFLQYSLLAHIDKNKNVCICPSRQQHVIIIADHKVSHMTIIRVMDTKLPVRSQFLQRVGCWQLMYTDLTIEKPKQQLCSFMAAKKEAGVHQ